MKRVYISFLTILPSLTFAQTVLYNGGTDITAATGAIIFVDGDIQDTTNGFIHNSGDIYLTRNWINGEPSGCLDPTTGKVWLTGNGTQIIKGGQTTTFNNLDCKTATKKILYINTIVGGTSGVLSLNNAPFDLNTKTLIVTNPLPAAITRTNGYIISETVPANYGVIEWRMGNSAAGNNFVYPFGTISGVYIPFLYDVKTAGTQTTKGDVSVATYPTTVTANPNNLPFPTGVTNLNDASGKNAAVSCLDRYWMVNANNYSSNPVADITFTYADDEWDKSIAGSTNNLVSESDLKGWKWNGTGWANPTVGTDNPSANTVMVTGVSGSAPWTLKGKELVCGDFFLPTAFSPNDDNHNERFKPRNNCLQTMDLRIYNRWGNLVYSSQDPNDSGWDGSVPGKGKDGNEGVYAYELNATLMDGTPIVKKGNVTLFR